MVEFKIQNQNDKDVLSYTDYRFDGSKVEGQVKNPENGDVLDPELFLQLFEKKAKSYEKASGYNDSFQKLYAFNPVLGSSENGAKVSIDSNTSGYNDYCAKMDDVCYGVAMEHSKTAKDNHLKNFKSFVGYAIATGVVASLLLTSAFIADHNYSIGESIEALKNPKSASEINTMQTTDEAFHQMIDDGSNYQASKR